MKIKDVISESIEFPSDSRGQARQSGMSQKVSQEEINKWKNISPEKFAELMVSYSSNWDSPEHPINYLPDDVLKSLFTEKNLIAAFNSPDIDYYDWREWIELFPESAFTPRSVKHILSIDPCFILFLSESKFGPEYVSYAIDVATKLLEKGDADMKFSRVETLIDNSDEGEDLPFIENPEVSSKFQQLLQKYKESIA